MSAVPNTTIESGSGTVRSIAPISPFTSVVWLLNSFERHSSISAP